MRTQLRIVAGSLRGRKLYCSVNPRLRPAPQMVREALFSILGTGIRGRPFFDLFAGTGAVGMEAISRGAAPVTFVERDIRLAADIEHHLRGFGVQEQARVLRADAYIWASRWKLDAAPVNVFLGPPFPDLTGHSESLLELVRSLQAKLPCGSVVALQAEEAPLTHRLPDTEHWDRRRYGRNLLLFWVKSEQPAGADN